MTDGDGAVCVLDGLRRILTLVPVEGRFLIRTVGSRSKVGLVGTCHLGKLLLAVGYEFLLTQDLVGCLAKTFLFTLFTLVPGCMTSVALTVLFRGLTAIIALDAVTRGRTTTIGRGDDQAVGSG